MSSSNDGGGTATMPPPLPEGACQQMRPIFEDFETALDPSWAMTNPFGLNLDTTQPLAGAQSLKVSSKAGAQPYVTIPIPSVCRLEITLKVRPTAQLLGSDQTDLLRVNANPSFYHLVLHKDGTLEFVHEYHGWPGPSVGRGTSYGKLVPEKITTIVLLIDARAGQYTGSATTDGLPPGYLSGPRWPSLPSRRSTSARRRAGMSTSTTPRTGRRPPPATTGSTISRCARCSAVPDNGCR
ncbi:hypothetical protein AKJ09_01645 [Labilithrix luteola]|uniref:Uncharacterized protein n=1 Tax=Labilithrix luteola TaxID=1391654 RepID=A0A0K1PNK8_9BACT|nr:hypothetical protein [Labilithrix luteola]AKU94981.1 hypothetical protein AKJ09_01645 [Labilithrix luteola]